MHSKRTSITALGLARAFTLDCSRNSRLRRLARSTGSRESTKRSYSRIRSNIDVTSLFSTRLRGEILLKVDPGKPAPAEEAFQTAIAVAKRARRAQLRPAAALSLAKLYQSTGRLAEAHAVLAPALEGFAPTPEMPEIAEAQALLVAIEAGAHVRHE